MSTKLFEMGRESLERQLDLALERARLMIQAGKLAEAKFSLSRSRVFLEQLQRVAEREQRGKGSSGECVEEGSGFTVVEPEPGLRPVSMDMDMPAYLRAAIPISLAEVASEQWRGEKR